MAVGSSDLASGPVVAESWNGTDWTLVPAPSPGTQLNALSGVSCTDPNFCVAVGYLNDDGGVSSRQAMIETWDGTSWMLAPSPDLGVGSSLSGVSCTATDNCVAVGQFDAVAGETATTLVESWNGISWTMAPSSVAGDLLGVSCTSSQTCVAVGSNAYRGSLVESWNGISWSTIPSPLNHLAVAGWLYGVSCGSSSGCEAVGFFETAKKHIGGSFNEEKTLIQTGSSTSTSWSETKSPNPPKAAKMEAVDLYGVSCTTTSYCLAVGGGNLHTNPVPLALKSGH